MNTVLEMACDLGNAEPRGSRNLTVQGAVRSMLAAVMPRLPTERRREQRYAYPYPIRLTPVTMDGSVSPAESIVVLGKHLSEHGADFYFSEPLPYRRVIASFERGQRRTVHLLMDLTWCRFSQHGWYENGGRFLQVLPQTSLDSDK